MAVDPEVSEAIVEGELEAARPLAEGRGWLLEKLKPLALRATILAKAVGEKPAETYIFEWELDDYRAQPPAIHVVMPDGSERDTKRCLPQDGHGYFHRSGYICSRWNRLAYLPGGPHANDAGWQLTGWAEASKQYNSIGMILELIWKLLNDSGYQGRQAP
jgi:hypothetical protein